MLQRLEEEEVQNLEEKEQMIMRDGEHANIMQHQEEDEAQKSMDKEQQAMRSTPPGKALVLVRRALSLHHFLRSSIPQNVGIPSKITTLAMDSTFFFAYRLLHLQAVLEFLGKKSLWT